MPENPYLLLYTAVNFLNSYVGDTFACITIAFMLQVLNNEVNAIRRACSSLHPDYTPLVTFLVVQKRHHTRFFPTRREDEEGRNRNVPPGTVVDSTITHPIELDFFLVSHASIQVQFIYFIVIHFKLNFSELLLIDDDE